MLMVDRVAAAVSAMTMLVLLQEKHSLAPLQQLCNVAAAAWSRFVVKQQASLLPSLTFSRSSSLLDKRLAEGSEAVLNTLLHLAHVPPQQLAT
jgi:hypothetical protein